MPVSVRFATADDAAVLHKLAQLTFPLACPPTATPESISDFISTQLSEERFGNYIADPARELLIVSHNDEPAGYSMLVYEEPSDVDVAASVTLHPTVELSKVYVVAGQHGAGVGAALMDASLAAARDRGGVGIWLGVNQLNPRANRFYEKHGFGIVGTKTFLLGGVYEADFVRERAL